MLRHAVEPAAAEFARVGFMPVERAPAAFG
jgi:hypothetical protein